MWVFAALSLSLCLSLSLSLFLPSLWRASHIYKQMRGAYIIRYSFNLSSKFMLSSSGQDSIIFFLLPLGLNDIERCAHCSFSLKILPTDFNIASHLCLKDVVSSLTSTVIRSHIIRSRVEW